MIVTERHRRVHTRRIRTAARIGLGAAAICVLPGAIAERTVRPADTAAVTVVAIMAPRPVLAQPRHGLDIEVSRSMPRHPLVRRHRLVLVVHHPTQQFASVAVGGIPAVWARVAACESTDHWHDNTGNGYYGGLQITASNAAHYHFARPDLLAPIEQIRLARLILRDQGPLAWPVCGPRAGLMRGD